jgi:hypothetical protein
MASAGLRDLLCDPCRLVRQVKKFAGWKVLAASFPDPCRLVRQVKKFAG